MLVDDDLTERIEQAGAEAGVVGADHLARRHCLGGDAPVAGRGVVHGVVETGWRNLPVIAGQLFAKRVAVVAVGTGGAEDGGQRADIGFGMGGGFKADGERQFDDAAGPAAFGRRQDAGYRQD